MASQGSILVLSGHMLCLAQEIRTFSANWWKEQGCLVNMVSFIKVVMCLWCRLGQVTHMVGDGHNIADFTFVENAVHAHVLAGVFVFSLNTSSAFCSRFSVD